MKLRASGAAVVAGSVTMFLCQVAAHAFIPWQAQTTAAGTLPLLGRQLALDLIVVSLFCALAEFLPHRSAAAVAKALAAVGFVLATMHEFSSAIWYALKPAWAAGNVAGHTLTLFLTGLAIGAVLQRLDPVAVALPQGQGYRISGGRKTVAR